MDVDQLLTDEPASIAVGDVGPSRRPMWTRRFIPSHRGGEAGAVVRGRRHPEPVVLGSHLATLHADGGNDNWHGGMRLRSAA